jgi:tetratricopeptide (TPR) repeat protein
MSEHELWNELGNLYFMSGAYDQAIVAYSRSIQTDDAYGKPYSNLALVYVHQGKYDEAVKLFRRSLDLLIDHKEKAISWNRLGKVYRQIKDYQQAVIAFQRADELDPECREDGDEPAKMLYASADLSDFMQKYSGSLPDLKEAASELNLSLAEPALEMADEAPVPAPESLIDTPVPEEMVETANPTDPSEPDDGVPIDAEAMSLTSWMDVDLDDDMDPSQTFSGETDIDLFSNITENPDNQFIVLEEEPLDQNQQLDESEAPKEALIPLPVESLNWQQTPSPSFSRPAARVDFPKAEQHMPEYGQEVAVAVEEMPVTPTAPVEKCEVESTQAQEPVQIETEDQIEATASREATDLDKEIEKYKRVVQINDRNASAWDALGTLYKSAGLYKESIQAHQQANSIDPNKPSYLHHLGLAFAGAGRDEDAIASFQRVIEMDPDHYLAHASLGGYYRKLGLEELAQKHIGKAMRNIYDSENEYNRACLDAICGNVDQAIELLRIALEKKQTYVEWIIHDPDLDFIREDARFKQLISNYTA